MKKLIPLLLLGAFTTASAQITLDESDFPVAGESFMFGTDRDINGQGFSVGTTGAGQTWDFTALETDSLFDVGFYVPGPLPGGDVFTTADMAVDQSGAYAFVEVGSGEVNVIGLGGDFGPQLGLPTAFDLTIPAVDPWTIFTFPSALNTAFTDTAHFDQTVFSDGLVPAPYNTFWDPDSVRIKRVVYIESEMDAEGTLTNPLGQSHNVLRMNVTETSMDTVWGWTAADGWERPDPIVEGLLGLPTMDVIHRLRFVSESLGYYVVEIVTDAGGNPESATFISDPSQCCTGIEEVVAAGQNVIYPNPTNGPVQVRTGGDIYEFQILDVSGKLIISTPLTYDGQTVELDELANGLYIYRMLDESGKVAHTGRLSCIK